MPQSIGLGSTMVFAKVETRSSLFSFKDILAEADGVCLSRGNLGLDCLPEKMASLQKAVVQVRGCWGHV
jgi:pyruvate kinase